MTKEVFSPREIFAICKLSKGEKYRFIKVRIVDFGADGVGRFMVPGEPMLSSINDLQSDTTFVTYCQGNEVEALLHKLNMILIVSSELPVPKADSAEAVALSYAKAQAEHYRTLKK